MLIWINNRDMVTATKKTYFSFFWWRRAVTTLVGSSVCFPKKGAAVLLGAAVLALGAAVLELSVVVVFSNAGFSEAKTVS